MGTGTFPTLEGEVCGVAEREGEGKEVVKTEVECLRRRGVRLRIGISRRGRIKPE